jgi:type IV secretion system protein VirB6
MEFFTNLFTDIDAAVRFFYLSHLIDVLDYAQSAMTTFAIVLVVCQGITLLMGWTDQPAKPVLMALATITFVMVVAGGVAKYNLYIGDFLRGLPDDLVQLMLGRSFTTGEALDNFGDSILLGIKGLWTNSSGVEEAIIAAVVCITFFIFWIGMSVAAAFALITSKIMLTILAALGPIFILCLMFPATKDYFSKWFTYSVSMAFLALIISSIIAVTNDFATRYFLQFESISDIDFTTLAAPALVLCGLFKLFQDAPSVASSLSGGLGLSVGNAISTAMRGAAAPVLKPLTKGLSMASERLTRPITQRQNAKKQISQHKITAAMRSKDRKPPQGKAPNNPTASVKKHIKPHAA